MAWVKDSTPVTNWTKDATPILEWSTPILRSIVTGYFHTFSDSVTVSNNYFHTNVSYFAKEEEWGKD